MLLTQVNTALRGLRDILQRAQRVAWGPGEGGGMVSHTRASPGTVPGARPPLARLLIPAGGSSAWVLP